MSEKKHEATGWYRWDKYRGLVSDFKPFSTYEVCLHECSEDDEPLYLEAAEPPKPRELWSVDFLSTGGFMTYTDESLARKVARPEDTVTHYREVIE